MRGVRLRVDVESRSLADRDRCRGTFKDHARDPVQLYAALQSPPSCSGPPVSGTVQGYSMRSRCVSVGVGALYLNPARMKHPQDPWKYRWSSHGAYVGEGSPVKIQTDAVLKQFASSQRAARREYLGFMKEGLGQGHLDLFYQTIEQRFLGDERFVDQLEKKKKEPEPPKLKVKFSRLVEGVAALYGIEAERLVGTERKRGWVALRSLLVYVAREWCGIKARVLAEHLNPEASMVSRKERLASANRDEIRTRKRITCTR